MYDWHLYPESTVLLLALNLKKNAHFHLKSSINIDLYKSKTNQNITTFNFCREEMRLFYWKIFHCATCILLFMGNLSIKMIAKRYLVLIQAESIIISKVQLF